jgi:beta-glucosidase
MVRIRIHAYGWNRFIRAIFEYHLKPFRAAIAAGAAQIMPYYGMPVDTQYEAVAFGYNKGIITGLLRDELGFDGIVCTDWGLVTDAIILGQPMPARAWGVEHLDELSRVEMILTAGCDQFGGEARPELVVQLVEQGRISEERIDRSVRRLLREKFILGLFDNPYVDPDHAAVAVGKAEFVATGEDAQRRAYTLLTNRDQILPLDGPYRLYVEGVSAQVASQYGEVVGDPADADVALLRLKAPYEPRPGGFEAMFHAGSLEFPAAERDHHAAVCSAVPTIVDVYLDRPAVLAHLADEAAALFGSYGSSDKAFLDIVFGAAQPEGSLPFDLPRSMAAVEASRSATRDTATRSSVRARDGTGTSNHDAGWLDFTRRRAVAGAAPRALTPMELAPHGRTRGGERSGQPAAVQPQKRSLPPTG